MGSTLFSFLSPHFLHHFFLNPTILNLQNPNFPSSNFRCSSSSRSNWRSTRRVDFQNQFRRREKPRNWWSDDDDDDDEDDEDLEFGFWEDSSTAVDWFFKIFRAFGWMVPAIMISTLLGTGTNSLIMAVVLPLGQTALSLVLDKLWGDPNSSPNFEPGPRSRSKSNSRRRSRPEWKSYVRTTNPRSRGTREPRRSANSSYQSWEAANNPSSSRGVRSGSKFGGWDELDQQAASGINFSEEPWQKVEVPEVDIGYAETGKLSRRISRDKPLLIRLLIAMFPFLGSWTRFLF